MLNSVHTSTTGISDATQLKNLGRQATNASDNEKLKQACEDFEALFIKQMLDSMRKTVQKSGLTEAGMAENIFEDMLYEKYSEKFAKNGSFGVGDMIYRQVSPMTHPRDIPEFSEIPAKLPVNSKKI